MAHGNHCVLATVTAGNLSFSVVTSDLRYEFTSLHVREDKIDVDTLRAAGSHVWTQFAVNAYPYDQSPHATC